MGIDKVFYITTVIVYSNVKNKNNKQTKKIVKKYEKICAIKKVLIPIVRCMHKCFKPQKNTYQKI